MLTLLFHQPTNVNKARSDRLIPQRRRTRKIKGVLDLLISGQAVVLVKQPGGISVGRLMLGLKAPGLTIKRQQPIKVKIGASLKMGSLTFKHKRQEVCENELLLLIDQGSDWGALW